MKWGTHETFLLSNNLTLPNAELARRLKRTITSVKCKKARMGYSAIHPRWTELETALLINDIDTGGRTKEACRCKRRRLEHAGKE
jgi:hypothetical protein